MMMPTSKHASPAGDLSPENLQKVVEQNQEERKDALEEVQHMHAQIESVVDSAYKEFKEAQVERTGAGKDEKGSRDEWMAGHHNFVRDELLAQQRAEEQYDDQRCVAHPHH